MKRSILIISSLALLAVLGFVFTGDAQSENSTSKQVARSEKQEVRRQRRAERLAAYERHIDSLVESRNFRFMPQTMQQMPAGMMRNLVNPNYELTVMDGVVDVCLPFLKGYTPPYYPVVFNYILPSVSNYTTVQHEGGWTVTFSSWLYGGSNYIFTLDIYSASGSAVLTVESLADNTVVYSGYITQVY